MTRPGSTRERQRNLNTWDGKVGPQHLGTGCVECWCGEPAFVQRNRARPRYSCQALYQGAAGRGARHAVRKKDEVETEIERVIMCWMADDGLYDQACRRAAGKEKLHARLDVLLAQQRRLVDSMEAVEMDFAERKRRAAPLVAEIMEVRDQIDAGKSHDALAHVTERGAAFAREWAGWDLAKRREITAALVSRVVLHSPPLRGGNAADPRFIQVFPAGWAREMDVAQPPPVPDAEALTSRGKVRTWLAALPPGQLTSAEDVAAGCGIPLYTARVALGKLLAAGEAVREWHSEPGAGRGADHYRWQLAIAPEGCASVDLREQVRAYLAALPAGKLAAATDVAASCGLEAETVRHALRKLLAAGEVQREQVPASGNGRPPYGWRIAA